MAPLSIVFSLLELLDPVEAKARKLEIRRKQEDHDDDDGDDPPQGRLDPAPPLTSRRPTPLSCKLCDFRAPQGQADAFCPRCLAETLRPDSK